MFKRYGCLSAARGMLKVMKNLKESLNFVIIKSNLEEGATDI